MTNPRTESESTMPQHHKASRRLQLGLRSVVLLVAVTVATAGSTTAPASSHSNTAAAGPETGTSAAESTALLAGRPNIVMVMADDMRVDDLDFAPNIRRLVGRRGLTFENSFSPFPLCCPARASFLSGLYAHNHKVYWHKKPYGYRAFDDSRTIATSLRRAGYRTGFIGKYLNGYGPDRSKVSGKRSFRYVPRGWSQWIGAFQGGRVKGVHGSTYNYRDTPYNVNGKVRNHFKGKYQTNVVGNFSVNMAKRFAKGRSPFFMYVSYVAPHHGSPHERDDPPRALVGSSDGTNDSLQTPARPQWVKKRFNKRITRPSGMPRGGGPAEADISDKPAFFRSKTEIRGAERRNLTKVTRQRAEAVFVMDRQVGRLVRKLKRTGEWKNTVLMFTSDNGYYLGEHRQRTGKVRAHEPSLRVPFLVTGPGMRSGQKRYDPISTVDISATILDIGNARPPHTPDGVSRWSTMRHGDRGWDTPVVTEAIHSVRGKRTAPGFGKSEKRTSIGLRTPRYSFTLYRNGEGELYDLKTDSAQMRNKFGDPDYRAIQAELTATWWDFKDCDGAECRAELPPGLRASAAETKSLTRGYWHDITKIYGR